MAKNRVAAMLFIAAGIGTFLILAVIMMVLGHGLLATLLLGVSLIVGGVLGLVTARRPYFVEQPSSSYPVGQSTAPSSGQNPPYFTGSTSTPAPATTPPGAPQAAEKITSVGIRRFTNMLTKAWNTKDFGAGRMSVRAMLIASGCLLLIAVLLLCNLLVALRPWFTVHETQVVECRAASTYTKDGWRITSSYSYAVEETPPAATTYTACVIERERFVWAGEKRAEKPKTLESTLADTPENTPAETFDPASQSMWATSTPTPQTPPTADTPPSPPPTAALPPTATTAPATSVPPTITPLPTLRPTETPLPTVTPDYPPDSPLLTPEP